MTTLQLQLHQFSAFQPSSSSCECCAENVVSSVQHKDTSLFNSSGRKKDFLMDILFCHGLLCSLIYFSFYGTCCCRALADVCCLIRRELTTHDCTFTTSPSSPHINPNSLLYSTSWICMTIFSPLYLTCLGETWTFVIFIFLSYFPETGKGGENFQGLGRSIGRAIKGNIL